MDDIAQKELRLFEALLGYRGIQSLMDLAAELLGNPLFFSDRGMSYSLASSYDGPQADLFRAATSGDQENVERRVYDAARKGYFDWIYAHDEPIEGTAIDDPCHYLSARVRDGADAIGHICVVDLRRPFEEGDRELLPVVCQCVAFELRRKADTSSWTIPYGPLFSGLLAGGGMGEAEARRQAEMDGLRVPARMLLLVARVTDSTKAVSLAFLRSQLLQAFPGSFGIVRENECAHVVNAEAGVDEVERRIAGSVYTGGMEVGLSWEFRELTGIHTAYVQADAALRLAPMSGEAAPGTVRLARFADAMVPLLAEALQSPHSSVPLAALVMPEVALLAETNRRDGTDHLGDLASYLACEGNVTRAARVRHVHKNSMYYRIGRLQELSGIDLSDTGGHLALRLSVELLKASKLSGRSAHR